ncbi:hypothetical protein N7488_003414 [Penicillium malachiteum]|nr:hypothetical protein N7488_003414 [Penicillium malachiteum]
MTGATPRISPTTYEGAPLTADILARKPFIYLLREINKNGFISEMNRQYEIAARLPPPRPQVTSAAVEEARRVLRELERRVRNSGSDDYEF